MAPPAHGGASSLDHPRREARQRCLRSGSRDASIAIDTHAPCSNAPLSAFDLGKHGAWHLLDVPMAGKICAAVALAGTQARVHAFGWPKSLAFGK